HIHITGRIGHVSAFNHHAFDQKTIFWRIPKASWPFGFATLALEQQAAEQQRRRKAYFTIRVGCTIISYR
uniref:Uncharacterized protein n=1 Tax=Denticeps clupeoides TaxID=299321 RepID=A0AAY4EKV3_9TELE